MRKPSRDEMELNLRAWAAELSAGFECLPILVSDICASLGIAIEKRESVPPNKAFLELDLANPKAATILLPNKKVYDFERFCVAHELAHYLLFMGFKVSPEDKEEYWLHEELCDDFARHLLMPMGRVEWLCDPGMIKADALSACDDLAVRARVPWTQAGLRISGVQDRLLFSRIRRITPSSFEVFSITRPGKRGRGKRIEASSPFGTALTQAQRRRAAKPQTLTPDTAADALKALSFESTALAAVQLRYTGKDFRVSVQMDG